MDKKFLFPCRETLNGYLLGIKMGWMGEWGFLCFKTLRNLDTQTIDVFRIPKHIISICAVKLFLWETGNIYVILLNLLACVWPVGEREYSIADLRGHRRNNQGAQGRSELVHLFTYSFIQQIFIEKHLVCARNCLRCWGHRREQVSRVPDHVALVVYYGKHQ